MADSLEHGGSTQTVWSAAWTQVTWWTFERAEALLQHLRDGMQLATGAE